MEEKIINNNLIDTKDESNCMKDLMVEAMKKVKDPFEMLSVEDVKKDIGICYSTAYDLFNREDFPAIQIGKKKKISRLAYMAWKIKNIEKVGK